MSGFNKNFKDGSAGLRGGANNASGGFQSSEAKSSEDGGGSDNSNPPIAFWDMEEGGEGTTATDRSEAGNNLDLTIRDIDGGALPTWDSGTKARGSYSLKIAGTKDQAFIADNAKLDFNANEAFSFSMWIKKVNSTSSSTAAFLSKMANSSPYRGYEVGFESGQRPYFYLISTWGSAALGVKTSVAHMGSSAAWHHIVVTYDGSGSENGVTIYHNAVGKTRQSASDALLEFNTSDTLSAGDTTTNSDIFALGSRASGLHNNIYMDDVAVFDYELTAAQVTSIYNSGDSLDVSDGIPA